MNNKMGLTVSATGIALLLCIITMFAIFVFADIPSFPAIATGKVLFSNGSIVAGQNVSVTSSITTKINQTDIAGDYFVMFNQTEYNTSDNSIAAVNFSDPVYGAFYGYTLFVLSDNFSYVNITVNDVLGPSVLPPSIVPGALGNIVYLNWTRANFNDTVRYTIVRNSTNIANITGIDNLSFNDTSVSQGNVYSYTVRAYDNSNNTATAWTVDGITVMDTVAPTPITGLSVASQNATLTLTWTKPSANASDLASYSVFSDVSGQTFRSLTTDIANSTYSTSYTGLTNGNTYHFNISACDNYGNCAANVSISATPNARPVILFPYTSVYMTTFPFVLNVTSGATLGFLYINFTNSSGIAVNETIAPNVGLSSVSLNYTPQSKFKSYFDGVYNLTVYVNDSTGQNNTERFSFSIDTFIPAVSSITMSSAYVRNDTLVYIVINFSEQNIARIYMTPSGKNFTLGINTSNVSVYPYEFGWGSQGLHTIFYNLTDLAGNYNDIMRSNITIDNTPPSLNISGNKSVWTKWPYNLTINISDQFSLRNVTYFYNGVVVYSNASIGSIANNRKYEINETGVYNFTAIAFDNLSNTNTSTVSVWLDRVNPATAISGITNGSSYTTNKTIYINATDSHSGWDHSIIIINSTQTGWNYTNNSVTASISVNVPSTYDANYTIYYETWDNANNVDNGTLWFAIDSNSPTLSVNSPYSSAWYRFNYNVTVNSTDTLGIKNISVDLSVQNDLFYNVAGATVYNFRFDINVSANQTINVTACDNSGNCISNFTTALKDYGMPVINVSGVNNSENYSQAITLFVSVNDSLSGFNHTDYWLYKNGSLISNPVINTSNFTLPITSEGIYLFMYQATDNVGNPSNIANVSFSVDTSAPVISINSPYSSYWNRFPFNVTVNCTDLLAIKNITVNVTIENDSFISPAASSYDFLIGIINSGNQTINVTACDILGHCTSSITNALKDYGMPIVNISGVSNYQNYSQNVTIAVTAYDILSGIDTFEYWLYKNGTSIDVQLLNLSTNTTIYFPITADGNYTFLYLATDKVGNPSNIANVSFAVDFHSPAYIAYGTSASQVNTTQSIILFANWTDFSAFKTASLYVNGALNSTMTGAVYTNFSWTAPSALAEQNVTFYIKINDTFGNTNQTPNMIVFVRDTTGPTVSLSTPVNQSMTNNNTIIFRFNATDNLGSVANCTLRINNVANQTTTGVTSGAITSFTSVTFATDASYLWNVSCFDNSGNPGFSSGYVFTLDTTKPSVTFSSNINNGIFADLNYVYINVTQSDTNYNYTVFRLYYSNGSIAGSLVSTAVANSNLSFTGLSDGRYYYNVTVFDLVGNNNATQTWNITLDTTNPSIGFSSDTEYDYMNRIYIYYNTTQYDTNYKNTTFRIYNQTGTLLYNVTRTDITNTSVYWTASNTNAVHLFNATVCDMVGRCNTTSTSAITLDTTYPAVSLMPPLMNTQVSWIYVTVSKTEINFKNITYYIYYGGVLSNSSSFTGTGNVSYNITSIDGNYTVNVSVCDLAQNCNMTASSNFVVDTSTPAVSIASGTIANNSFTNVNTTTIYVTLSDNYFKNITYQLINATGGIVNSTTYLTQITNITFTLGYEDVYSVNVTVYDIVWHINRTTPRVFTYDKTQPNIAINTPQAANTTSAIINFTVTDNYAINLSKLSVSPSLGFSLSSCTGTATNINCVFTASNLSQGYNTIIITAYDNATNQNTTNRTFGYDTTAPTVSDIVNPTSSSNASTEPIVVYVNVTDGFVGIDKAWFLIDSNVTKNTITLQAQKNITINHGLSAGTHSVTIFANDTLGNTVNTSINVYVAGSVNVSDVVSQISSDISNTTLKNVTIEANGVDLTSNQTSINVLQLSNITMSLDVNVTGLSNNITQVDIIIPNGISVNWGGSFNLSVNDTTVRQNTLSKASLLPIEMLVFSNFNNFVANEADYNATIYLKYNVIALGLKVLYFTSDDKVSFIQIDSTASQNGYYEINSTLNWTIVHLPHLSGIVVVNDTLAPQNFIDKTRFNNSYFNATGFILEANLNTSYTRYNVTNATNAIVYSYEGSLATTNVSYNNNTYGVYVKNLTNGIYNVTIVSSDNQARLNTSVFTINVTDIIAPSIAVSPTDSSDSSTADTMSKTVTVTSDELVSIVYQLNGGNWTNPINNTVSSSFSVTLVQGTNNLTVNGTDINNNAVSVTRTYNYTKTAAVEDNGGPSGGGGGAGAAAGGAVLASAEKATLDEASKLLSQATNQSKTEDEKKSLINSAVEKQNTVTSTVETHISLLSEINPNLILLGITNEKMADGKKYIEESKALISQAATEQNISKQITLLNSAISKQKDALKLIPEVSLMSQNTYTKDSAGKEDFAGFASLDELKTSLLSKQNIDSRITKSLKIYNVTNKDMVIKSVYASKITISYKFDYEVSGLELIEYVSKDIANSTDEISFTVTPNILQKDPIFSWGMGTKKEGSVSYSVAKILDNLDSTSSMLSGDIDFSAVEEKQEQNTEDQITGNQVTTSKEEVSGSEKESQQSTTPSRNGLYILLAVIIIAVIIGGVIYFVNIRKKNPPKGFNSIKHELMQQIERKHER